MKTKKLASMMFFSLLSIALVWSALPQYAVKAAEAKPKYGGTLMVLTLVTQTSLNPSVASGDLWLLPLANSRLVTYNQNYEIVGDLAESWEISPDAKTFTFHLHKNVKWHDGQPFTSQDVKFTFESQIAMKGWYSSRIAEVDKIECPDDYTVVIKLKATNAAFLDAISNPGYGYIIPKHIFDGTDITNNTANENWVGLGPFRFVKWVKGQSVEYVRNPDYWRKDEDGNQLPYLDKVIAMTVQDVAVIVKMIEKGEGNICWGGVVPSEIVRLGTQVPSVRVQPQRQFGENWIYFKLSDPILKDVRVRKAIAMAYDREDINKKVYLGTAKPWNWLYSGANWSINYAAKAPGYDPKGAEELLDLAGYPKGGDGKRFSLTYDVFYAPAFLDVAAVIRDVLGKIGIDITIKPSDWSSYLQKVKTDRNFQLAFYDFTFGPDPTLFQDHVGTGGSSNIGQYSNATVDDAFAKLKAATTLEERQKWIYKIQEILAQDLIRIPVVTPLSYAIHSADFHGWHWEPQNWNSTGQYFYERVWQEGGGEKAQDYTMYYYAISGVTVTAIVAVGGYALLRRRKLGRRK